MQAAAIAPLLLACLIVGAQPSPGGDKAFGEYLSSECVTCHQVSGAYAGIPPIVGWPDASFIQIMNDYRQKRRDNPVMRTIAGRLSDEEIAALASYFGSMTAQSQVK
jgi:cytochrome c553